MLPEYIIQRTEKGYRVLSHQQVRVMPSDSQLTDKWFPVAFIIDGKRQDYLENREDAVKYIKQMNKDQPVFLLESVE